MSENFSFDVFISYAHEDRVFVPSLAERLERLGFLPWFSEPGGVSEAIRAEQIKEAVNNSATCILLFGPSNNLPWNNDSFLSAIDARLERSHGEFILIPVSLPGGRTTFPPVLPRVKSLRRLQQKIGTFVKFEKTLDEDEATKRLVLRLRGVEPDEQSLWALEGFRNSVSQRARNALNVNWRSLATETLHTFTETHEHGPEEYLESEELAAGLELFSSFCSEATGGSARQINAANTQIYLLAARLDEFEFSGLDAHTAPLRAEQSPAYGEPQNAVEEALASIWAQVLGVERVSTHDNFFTLGGDSIISIQISARAAQQGIRLTPKHLFQHHTIAELAAVVGMTPAAQAKQGLVAGPVPLTPVQQSFFERNLPEPHAFTQAVLIEVRRQLAPSLLAEVARQLLLHHDALRLRYERGENGWSQVNSGEVNEAPFSRLDLSALPEDELDDAVEAAIEAAQSSIDLSAGALLKVTLLEQGAGRPDLVLLTVHHLAVDVVSWRILIEDFQSLYEQLSEGRQPQLTEKTTAFKEWAERMAAHVGAGVFDEHARYWLDQLRGHTLPVDFEGGQNTLSSARVVTSALGHEETGTLLQEVPQVYRTQVNEALLTALTRAFVEWSGDGPLLVEMEGHGREEVFDDVDLSRTVGWFTSHYPVLLETEKNAEPGDELKRVKEQLRRLPSRGVSFGLLRCFGAGDDVARLRECRRPEVSFNYLGQFEHENAEFSSFGKVRSSRGASLRMPGKRTHLLEVDAKVIGGRLELDWTYSENVHRRETVEALAAQFDRALRALIEHCQSPESGGFTPSDFPEEELSRLVALKSLT